MLRGILYSQTIFLTLRQVVAAPQNNEDYLLQCTLDLGVQTPDKQLIKHPIENAQFPHNDIAVYNKAGPESLGLIPSKNKLDYFFEVTEDDRIPISTRFNAASYYAKVGL